MPQSTINEMQSLFSSVILSLVLTVLRVAYDNKETRWQRVLFEAMLNVALTVAGWSVVIGLDYPPILAVGIGGLLAFLGVDTVRSLARKKLNEK